jgi:adenine specific DNA methylase Mod
MTNEKRFYDELEKIFVGVEVKGESGYINLMKIKSNYYEKGVFPKLQTDIDNAVKPFSEPKKFKEELFDKLYTFFHRYFSESGSIYFNFTPSSQDIYEKVYTDDKDVMLFWKTHMLYYVKSERLFKNLEIPIDDFKFFFDVSEIQHKKAFEKKEIIFEFKEVRRNGIILFNVFYSERGRKTKIDEILKALKKEDINITEEALEKAFRVFEKQSEVDYFINKNAKQFLREQFNLWLYQYVFSGASEWTEQRIKQLQVYKDIAYKIIDFISQFEDELVKIWNKPKFVQNSNYVITLDRLNTAIIEKIEKHKNFKEQIKEWKELGIIQNQNSNAKIDLFDNTLHGEKIKKEYEHLPIDTKHFKDLELKILALFENLDESLDGWLIKSENYQALNSILPKFTDRVQTIYIDPPFNKEQEADYFYSVKYKDSSWVTLLENRLWLAKDMLNSKGSIFTRCDYNGNMLVRLLMNKIFEESNFRNEIILRKVNYQGTNVQGRFNPAHDILYFYNKEKNKSTFDIVFKERGREANWVNAVSPKENKEQNTIYISGQKYTAPKGHHWRFSQTKFDTLFNDERIRIKTEYEYIDVFGKIQTGIPQYLESKLTPVDSNWTDESGYSFAWQFQTENSEILLKRVIESTSKEDDLIVDYFLGIGTSIAVAQKRKRKWLGVEMGDHFYRFETDKGPSGILIRMKEVLAGKGNHEPCGISKEVKWDGGGFFKYYEFEQYEDTLRKVIYKDSELFDNPDVDPYQQYIFMKDERLLSAIEIDYKKNKVKVDLSKIYQNIDVPETLSNILGKWIRKITKDSVVFEDDSKVNLNDLDYKMIKPLIWW